jgi:protein involved in polysaccharide export with SLBB domain
LNKGIFFLLTISLFFLATSCRTSKPARINNMSEAELLDIVKQEDLKTTEGRTYRLTSLDVIEVEVFQEPELSKKFKISPLGTINYPLLGAVSVENLTVSEAEAKITKLLAENYLVDPRVNVIVSSTANRRVNIFGEVKKPGTFSISTDEPFSLLATLSKAGGFTDIADIKKVRIVRRQSGEETIIKVNVADLINGKNDEKDIPLMNGDIITVPETWL